MKSNFRWITGYAWIGFATLFAGAAAHAQSAFTEIAYGSYTARLGPGSLRDGNGMPYALYIFDGEAGRRVSATIAAQTFSPAIALYRVSDGSTLATAHGKSRATASAVLQDDGLYILSVTSVDQTYRYAGTRTARQKIEMIGKDHPMTVRFAPGTVTVSYPGYPGEAAEYKMVEPNLYERSSGGEWWYIRVLDSSTLERFHGRKRKTSEWPELIYKLDTEQYSVHLTSEDAASAGMSAAINVAQTYALQNGDQTIAVQIGNGTMTVAVPGGRPAEYKQVEPNLYEILSTDNDWLYFRVVDPNTLEWFSSRVRRRQDRPSLVYKVNTGQYSTNLTSGNAVAARSGARSAEPSRMPAAVSFFGSTALNDARRMGYQPDTVLVHHTFTRNQVLADNPNGVYFEEKGGRGHLFNRDGGRVATNGWPWAKSRYALVRVNARWESGRKNGGGIRLYYPSDSSSLYVYLYGDRYIAQTYAGQWTVQVPSTKHSAIRPDADNVLELLMIDGRFRLYINSVFAHEFTLSPVSEPAFHYFANGGAVYSFDDYVAVGLERQ